MPETSPTIHYQAAGGVARLEIDNPGKLNAMTFEMWASLPELVKRAEGDPAVRLIVLSGAGPKAFCAGADISQFSEKRASADGLAAYDRAVLEGSHAMSTAEKPTLAVIRGICFGGGCALAVSCDLRIGSDDSRFRIPAARLGLGYGYEGIATLVRQIGTAATADLLLTARTIHASDALRLGVVGMIFDSEQFKAEAEAYITRIAENAPLTLRAVKRALIELSKSDAERDVASVGKLVKACFLSTDYREGQAAFKERRQPQFRGE